MAFHKPERLVSIHLKDLRVSIQYPKQFQLTANFLLKEANKVHLTGLELFYVCTMLEVPTPDVILRISVRRGCWNHVLGG